MASVFATLWMKNFLNKVATLIEGNNHRSEIGDRSVAAQWIDDDLLISSDTIIDNYKS